MAVLDDDREVTDSVCAQLEFEGYSSRAFYRTTDLEARLDDEAFDAFVIDWNLDEEKTAAVISTIRKRDATAPIVVLTAQVTTGTVDEADIAGAVASLNLLYSEKPVRMSILAATLTRALVTL